VFQQTLSRYGLHDIACGIAAGAWGVRDGRNASQALFGRTESDIPPHSTRFEQQASANDPI